MSGLRRNLPRTRTIRYFSRKKNNIPHFLNLPCFNSNNYWCKSMLYSPVLMEKRLNPISEFFSSDGLESPILRAPLTGYRVAKSLFLRRYKSRIKTLNEGKGNVNKFSNFYCYTIANCELQTIIF